MRFHAVASLLAVGVCACAGEPAPRAPAKLLGNPVLDARAALAAGDSAFLGLLDPELQLPGLEGSEVRPEGERTVSVFSRRSLAVGPSAWRAQRDSLRVYAAAYNRLILDARRSVRRAT